MPAQRLSLSADATSTGTGTATFSFQAPPTNLVYIGTLTLTAAPSGAAFTATVGGFPWCSWAGPSVGGPVQALPGEVVQVTATGLAANTAYTLQWTGRSNSAQETQPEYPDTNSSAGGAISQPPGTSLSTSLIGGALQTTATEAGAGTVILLAAPPNGQNYLLHQATFNLGSGATALQVVGQTTGFVYAQASGSSGIFDPLMGQVVNEQLNFVAVGGGGSVWLSYDLGPPPVTGGTGVGLTAWGQASTAKYVGSGSPVGLILPSGIGDLYVDRTTPALWQATAVSTTGWEMVGPPVNIATTVFTANAYTFALSDAFTAQQASNGATAAIITVPANATVAFPVGTVITITQTGTGKIQVAAAGGVTVNSAVPSGFVSGTTGCRAQYSSIGLLKTGANTWILSGDAA